MRDRDARPEYARSSDFRFENSTLIPLLPLTCASRLSLSLSRSFFLIFSLSLNFLMGTNTTGARMRADAGRYWSLHGHQHRATYKYAHSPPRTHAHTHVHTHTSTKEISCRTYRRPLHCWLVLELRSCKAGRKRKKADRKWHWERRIYATSRESQKVG